MEEQEEEGEEVEEVEEGTWATAVARMTRIWGSSWLSHFLILRKTGNVLDQQPLGEEEDEEEEEEEEKVEQEKEEDGGRRRRRKRREGGATLPHLPCSLTSANSSSISMSGFSSSAGMSARRKWGGRQGASRRGGVAPVRMSVSWVSRFLEGGLGEGGGGFESGAKGG